MKFSRLLILSLFVSSLCQCSYFKMYKADVQQGNSFDDKAISKLKVGMNKDKVSEIMGTPALLPAVDTNKWVYSYYLIPGDGKPREDKTLVLHFSNDVLKKIDTQEK